LIGPTRRSLCAGILVLQSVVLLLTTPVMLTLTDTSTNAALVIGVGLTVACLLAAGIVGRPGGHWLGWAVQVASIVMGFVVTVMFALGVIFLALFAGSWVLGGRIDRERAEREALG
jgi:hypothetical protein